MLNIHKSELHKAQDRRKGLIFVAIVVAFALAICLYSDCSQVKVQEPDIKATLVNEPEFNLVLIKTDGHFHLCGAIACADSLGFSPDKLLIITFPDTNGVIVEKTESGKRALLAGAVIHSFLFDLEESTVREMLLKPVPTGFAIYNDAKQCLFIKIMPALKEDLNLIFGYTKLIG